ncbi:MAG: Fur family transcriptional regulator [Ruminococcus sp.]
MSGQNFSRKRQMILDTINSTKTHPSAKWIYDTLKEEIPDLSLGTVYRNLALFLNQGLITSVASVNGEERFDGDTSLHAHFVCNKCNSVYDIPLSDTSNLLLGEQNGFEVQTVFLTYYGNCRSCTENK